MQIEVVYALADSQQLLTMEIVPGTTARAAVVQSAMHRYFPALNLKDVPIGIFGECVADNHVLQEGDRVELYRPLQIDPMEARRRRAALRPDKSSPL